MPASHPITAELEAALRPAARVLARRAAGNAARRAATPAAWLAVTAVTGAVVVHPARPTGLVVAAGSVAAVALVPIGAAVAARRRATDWADVSERLDLSAGLHGRLTTAWEIAIGRLPHTPATPLALADGLRAARALPAVDPCLPPVHPWRRAVLLPAVASLALAGWGLWTAEHPRPHPVAGDVADRDLARRLPGGAARPTAGVDPLSRTARPDLASVSSDATAPAQVALAAGPRPSGTGVGTGAGRATATAASSAGTDGGRGAASADPLGPLADRQAGDAPPAVPTVTDPPAAPAAGVDPSASPGAGGAAGRPAPQPDSAGGESRSSDGQSGTDSGKGTGRSDEPSKGNRGPPVANEPPKKARTVPPLLLAARFPDLLQGAPQAGDERRTGRPAPPRRGPEPTAGGATPALATAAGPVVSTDPVAPDQAAVADRYFAALHAADGKPGDR